MNIDNRLACNCERAITAITAIAAKVSTAAATAAIAADTQRAFDRQRCPIDEHSAGAAIATVLAVIRHGAATAAASTNLHAPAYGNRRATGDSKRAAPATAAVFCAGNIIQSTGATTTAADQQIGVDGELNASTVDSQCAIRAISSIGNRLFGTTAATTAYAHIVVTRRRADRQGAAVTRDRNCGTSVLAVTCPAQDAVRIAAAAVACRIANAASDASAITAVWVWGEGRWIYPAAAPAAHATAAAAAVLEIAAAAAAADSTGAAVVDPTRVAASASAHKQARRLSNGTRHWHQNAAKHQTGDRHSLARCFAPCAGDFGSHLPGPERVIPDSPIDVIH
nr:hypothetical protein [Paraburkholderia hiiakae]